MSLKTGIELPHIRSVLQTKSGEDVNDFGIDAKIVEGIFHKLNTRISVGPDNVCGRRPKSCTSQLSIVFSKQFAWSLREKTVPHLWKTYVVCPVPKYKDPLL